MYYCKTRYYVPEWCRWLNADSVDYLDPSSANGLNLYAYCNNNPVMCYDPSGNMPKRLKNTLKIAGAVAASPLGIWGQVGVNALISDGSYTLNSLDNFNLVDFALNTRIGALAGRASGAGWMAKDSTFATDLALNGIKNSFGRMGVGMLKEFAVPIIKSTIIGASGLVVEFVKKLFD